MGLERSAVSVYGLAFSELISLVYMMCDDPARDRFDLTLVKRYINDAMLDIALDAQTIKEDTTIRILKGQYVYEANLFAENEGKRHYAYPLRMVFDVATNAAVKPSSRQELDLGPVFHWAGGSTEGSTYPLKWYTDVFSHGEVGVWPPPTADGSALPALTGNVRLTYVAYPTPMTADSDVPDTLRGIHHEAIAYRAARMLLDDGNENDLLMAESLDNDAEMWLAKIVGDEYRGMTPYTDVEPM